MSPQAPQTGKMENPPDSYLTLGTSATAEIKIQRSRFIGVAAPAADEAEAREFIQQQARIYHDSRHACYGWRLGTAATITEKRNDDGEPSGTAGEPILAEIRKLELTQTVVVVVRYFGGIKLGTGGLARAYGQAAAEALAAAPIRTVLQGSTFAMIFPYALQKTLGYLLAQFAGHPVKEEYGAEVTWTIWLPHSRAKAFESALTETTAGVVQLVQTPSSK